jgi:hypothetical protein
LSSEQPAGRRDAQPPLFWVIVTLVVAGVMTAVALDAPQDPGDYGGGGCRVRRTCDDPEASLYALAHGDVDGFFELQPAMGMLSLLLRAPLVAAAYAFDGGEAAGYRLGSLACLLVLGLAGVWLARLAVRRGATLYSAVALIALVVAAGATLKAIGFGHPEEAVAAALAVAAVAMAAGGSPVGAGLLAGAAFGTKEWALLAAPVVIVALPAAVRLRAALAAAVTAGVLRIPMAIGDARAYRTVHAARTSDRVAMTPSNVWWRLHRTETIAIVVRGQPATVDLAWPPKLLARLARPGAAVLCFALALLYARRRERDPWEALGLLALLFLLRVLLDTVGFAYHHIPLVVALAAWETLGRRRFPVVALATIAALEVMSRYVSVHMTGDEFNAIYLAWTLPLAGYLAWTLFRPPARAVAAA